MKNLKNDNFYTKILLLAFTMLVFSLLIADQALAADRVGSVQGTWNSIWGTGIPLEGRQPVTSCGVYCAEWDLNYCSGNSVYQQRVCYNRTRSGDQCLATSSFTESRLVFNCGGNQNCQSGKCVNNVTPALQCTSGACCQGGAYKSAGATCNSETQVEYACPWGNGCSSDVGKRTKTKVQYCSGASSQCTGAWSDWSNWSNWQVQSACSGAQACVSGNPQCQSASACAVPAIAPAYIRNFAQICEGNSLYWFDTNGVKQSVIQDCSDNNECTQDICQGNQCLSELKCDGTTCAVDSESYRQNCQICGNNTGNSGEPASSCEKSGLVVVLLSQNSKTSLSWQKTLQMAPGENIDFLMIVKNLGDKQENISAKAELPAEVVYKGNLKLNNESVSGDIKQGVNIGSLESKEVKIITFQGQVEKQSAIKNKEVNIVATAKAGDLSQTDSVKMAFSNRESGLAAIGTALRSLVQGGIWIPLLITIFLLWFAVKMVRIWFFEK